MITLTPNSEKHFLKHLEKNQSTGITVSLKRAGCSGFSYVIDLVQDKPSEEQFIETGYNGILFYLEKEHLDKLNDLTIDVQNDNLSEKLVFINPNEKNSCGCGESIRFEK
tara:strand:- start:421 stop:750 length:330 start_codon:yes stop_codon:yes gene_type:complete